MIQITRQQADRLIKKYWHSPTQKLVICAFGKWYDIRGMTNEQIRLETHKLMAGKFGVPVTYREADIIIGPNIIIKKPGQRKGTMPLDQAHLDRKVELEAVENRDENQEAELKAILEYEESENAKDSQPVEPSEPEAPVDETENPPVGSGEAPADAGDVTPEGESKKE